MLVFFYHWYPGLINNDMTTVLPSLKLLHAKSLLSGPASRENDSPQIGVHAWGRILYPWPLDMQPVSEFC